MEQRVVVLFLIFFALEFSVEFILNELNLRHVRTCWTHKRIPDFFRGKLSAEQYQTSVDYTIAKSHFGRWSEIYHRTVTVVILFSGLLAALDRLAAAMAGHLYLGSYGHGVFFCLMVGLCFFLAGLATDYYSTFALEAKFGFNKTSVGVYVADKIKGLTLGLLLGVPFLSVVLWLMDVTGSLWWLWAFAFISVFQLLMIVIFPTVIAPWFNKFEPLKDGEFRDKILALADQVGFKTSGIYSMDGSKRSAHSNAYFTGVGRSKRIVLFDTLLEQMNMKQGLAVLAHEMGHYKMKHIRRMLIVQMIFLLIGLFILNLLLDYRPLYTAFALQPSHHAALVLFSLLAGPFTFFLGPLMNLLSRKHEYEADHFAAVTLEDGKAMEEALINLTVTNASNLTPHPWYSAYHYSHPTPAERIDAIRQTAMQNFA